ncbi:hypothetical protein DPMN_185217 [Dreissena polymorpha]|uniref:Uncharacterized protein n=1 Tax=Dreissena polymorpha TaxID=45954 RepID=A0A9D4I8J0_DREPO|nr:hypothetical protein DPMN_185217 [Dreissena polymorpha]
MTASFDKNIIKNVHLQRNCKHDISTQQRDLGSRARVTMDIRSQGLTSSGRPCDNYYWIMWKRLFPSGILKTPDASYHQFRISNLACHSRQYISPRAIDFLG